MIDIFSKIENVQISCLAENKETYNLLTIKIPNKKYKIKIVDSLSFLQSNLNLLSDDLENELKVVTKKHFKEKFEMVNKKLENFPYNYLNPNNLNEENLPEMKNFDNILTMKEITDKEYKKVELFYKKMGFKNLKEYLQCYLTSDITLSKDCALKYSKCKIQHIKDVSIFQFVKNTIMGGLSDMINPYVKLDNIKKESIVYNDISSQYPNELRRKLSYKDYKFVKEFDENRYDSQKEFGCFRLCDVKTTGKFRKDPLYSQCPMLVSKSIITDKNLSEYQLNQIKNKRKNKTTNYESQSPKLITNIGNDSNCYLNHEMYKMMKEAGYNIQVKKVLEFKQKEIFKDYIEYLHSKKKQYSLEEKKSFEFIYKILMNSFYGACLTDKTRFRDIRIVTSKRQAIKLVNLPNYHSINPINEKLAIVELSKKKCVVDSPIMIGSQVLFNSKCNLYNYMYNHISKLFGRENIIFSCQDSDSIMYKINNCSYKQYLEILKENPHLFNKELGLMENEVDENIQEIISLRAKCYSILTVNCNIRKAKAISKNYCNKCHNHQYFENILFNKVKQRKGEYCKISKEKGTLITELITKDDINNFNDKRFMIDNVTRKPHCINI